MNQRFVRQKPFLAGGFRSWLPPHARTRAEVQIGDFLGRLWALLGPPHSVDDGGFDYYLHDTERDMSFTASCHQSGPVFHALPRDRDAVGPSIDAFEVLLEATQPIDCFLRIPAEHLVLEVGMRDGVAFERVS